MRLFSTLLLAAAAIAFAAQLPAQTPSDSPAPAPAESSGSAAIATPVVNGCLVSAIDDTQVSAKEAGVITSISVKEGQLVSNGDLLAQIDDAQPQMEKRKAMAEKKAAEAKANSDVEKRYDTAAAEVAKYGYLKKKEANDRVPGAVSGPELQEARLQWTGAVLKCEQADLEALIARLTVDDKQAEVDAADEAIRRRQIRSPQDGVVEEIVPHVGEWVKPGDSVIRIVRIDRLQVEGFLKGDAYNPWEVQDRPVTVYVKLARQIDPVAFTGRITYVDKVKEAGNSFRVKASVENRLAPGRKDEWLLHPGDTATMKIDLN
jgi:multidrug efflux pump subunit AcrA (membrane-fusion protein)